MVSESATWYAAIWVGELSFAAVWLVAHLYAVEFGLQGIGALVEDIVFAELDRRDV